MRLIDADALHEALKNKQKWVVRRGDKHNEGYTYDQVHFAIDEAPTIEAVSIDDYRSMENTSKEPQTVVRLKHFKCPKCGRSDFIRSFEDWGIDGGIYKYKCINCTYIKDEPQTEREGE